MSPEERENVALARYAVVSTLKNHKQFYKNDKELIIYGTTLPFEIDGVLHKPVSWYTIRRWYRAYEKDGFNGLFPTTREDKGEYRKLDDDLKQKITNFLSNNPDTPSTSIFRKLLEEGAICDGEVSLSTVTRYVKEVKAELREGIKEDKRRYERAHRNEVWYGDTMVAFKKSDENGVKRKVYVFVLIDDASRLVTGCFACMNDDKYNLHLVLGEAMEAYGVPDLLVFDNGSNYRSKAVKLLAAKVGTRIHYCLPYEPTQKAYVQESIMENRTVQHLYLRYGRSCFLYIIYRPKRLSHDFRSGSFSHSAVDLSTS